MNVDNYFKINVFKIHQIPTGCVLVGKIKYIELLQVYKFTERQENYLDPFDSKSPNENPDDVEFQRHLQDKKTKEMVKYLKDNFEKKEKSLGLFPSSLILALELYSDYEGELNDSLMNNVYDAKLKQCFVNNEGTELYIPKNKRIALVVDGQHRLYSTQKFFDSLYEKDKKIIDDFEFPVTFLVGFDIYQVAQIFATVNFTQKPVNRSIYYDIFGSIPGELSDIKLAHDLALYLNNNSNSPVKKMIKLLGRGYGLFSQAFFVKKMLIHFKKGGVWAKIYSDYLRGGKDYRKIPNFMKIYLDCIKEEYSECWPEMVEAQGELIYNPYDKQYKYEYILCKPVGIGAFFRLINEIYPLVKDLSNLEMKKEINKILTKISIKQAKELFSITGIYGKSSSEGLVTRLYKEQLKKRYGFK